MAITLQVREPSKNADPPPTYENSSNITLAIFYGGRLVHSPSPEYVDGNCLKIDYFIKEVVDMGCLHALCEDLKLTKPQKFYRKVVSGFHILRNNAELKMHVRLSAKEREVVIYIKADVSAPKETDDDSELQTQPQTQSQIERETETQAETLTQNMHSGSTFIECDWSIYEGMDIHMGSESWEDSDYHAEISVNDDDDVLYDYFVDSNEEWGGIDNLNEHENAGKRDEGVRKVNSIDRGSERESSSEDDIAWGSDVEFNSGGESDGEENRPVAPVFNSKRPFAPRFDVGMKFKDKTEFRKAVHAEAVQSLRSIKIQKNDKHRVYAKCLGERCEWRIHAYRVQNESTFQIQTYHPHHTCKATYDVSNLKSSYLAERYKNKLRTDPNRNTEGFRLELIEDAKVSVSWHQAYRAKKLALEMIEGDPALQYSKLWDYAAELRRTNPGSTIILAMDEGTFLHFYCCFGALKAGFLAGCRPILGIDGCHLSSPHKGVLLTAVGIDPNNKPYPVAYAVVSKETRETWQWFLALLKEDLQIIRPHEFTWMSDKQKGLIQAMESVFPESDHRFCVRHLWKNFMHAGFKGLVFKTTLWRAANSTTLGQFKEAMRAMASLDQAAAEWFNDKPPHQWSKSHFSPFSKCDMVSNNFCESFNASILAAREKSILTMLEWIREYLVTRLQKNRDKAAQWTDSICPTIMDIMNDSIEKLGDCIPRKSDDKHYQITHYYGSQFTVDLENCTCSCRKWDLTGIPYLHAISAMCSQRLDPVDFIIPCYSVEVYKRVYEHAIMGINGQELWGETIYIPPLPPDFTKNKERSAKARKRDIDEPASKQKKRSRGNSTLKIRRRESTIRCTHCTTVGHNLRTCPVKSCGNPRRERENESGVEFESLDFFGWDENIGTQTSQIGSKSKQKVTRRRTRTQRAKPNHGAENESEGQARLVESHRSTVQTNKDAPKKVPGPSMFQQLQMSQCHGTQASSLGKKKFVRLGNLNEAIDRLQGKKKVTTKKKK